MNREKFFCICETEGIEVLIGRYSAPRDAEPLKAILEDPSTIGGALARRWRETSGGDMVGKRVVGPPSGDPARGRRAEKTKRGGPLLVYLTPLLFRSLECGLARKGEDVLHAVESICFRHGVRDGAGLIDETGHLRQLAPGEAEGLIPTEWEAALRLIDLYEKWRSEGGQGKFRDALRSDPYWVPAGQTKRKPGRPGFPEKELALVRKLAASGKTDSQIAKALLPFRGPISADAVRYIRKRYGVEKARPEKREKTMA